MEGDRKIDELMLPVARAIKHAMKGRWSSDIYNRAYEAMMAVEAENQRLSAEISRINAILEKYGHNHPRAMKLLKKQKPFLVVANDEPYYRQVYDLIRDQEMQNGTWTTSDEWHYEDALAALAKNGVRDG